MPYRDYSTLEQLAVYGDENGSPVAKFVLAFYPTFQGLENASLLNELGSVEMHLSLL
jgi:hypothetical protein